MGLVVDSPIKASNAWMYWPRAPGSVAEAMTMRTCGFCRSATEATPSGLPRRTSSAQAAVACEKARLRPHEPIPPQVAQRILAGHDDIGIEAGSRTYLDGRVAEIEGALPQHGDDNRLRQRYDGDVFEPQAGKPAVRLGPVSEKLHDLAAEQDGKVISLGEDDEVVGTDPPDNVRHGVGMPVELGYSRRHLGDYRPSDEPRLRRRYGLRRDVRS